MLTERMLLMKEIWKPIKGFEGLYQVSNLGNVRSLNYHGTGIVKLLTPTLSVGYYRVTLSKNGIARGFHVHRLVGSAFIPNPHGYDCINHKDESRTNNRVDNLEWCTKAYNNTYGTCRHRQAITRSTPILQILNGVVVRKWDSIKDVASYGYNASNVCQCCKNRRGSHKGYEWQYAT